MSSDPRGMKAGVVVLFIASVPVGLWSCKSTSTVERGAQELQVRDSTIGKAAPDTVSSESIGVAQMISDGTVVLDLRAIAGGGQGEARMVYPPSHPRYREIVEHLGGLKPGETKPVPPWP